MNFGFKNFIKDLIFFTIIIGIVLIGCSYLLSDKYFIKSVFLILPLYFFITALSYFLISKTQNKTFLKFTNSFMLATSLKLIVLLFFLLIWVFTHRSQAVVFIIWYFLLYLAFTIFEVSHLQRFDRKPGK
jgi:hypothetical protein